MSTRKFRNQPKQPARVPLIEATVEEKEQTWKRLEEIQNKVGEVMRRDGKTEEEFDRLIQEKP